jgi:hypothetical protein
MQRLKDKRLTQKKAAQLLGMSTRQVKPLWRACFGELVQIDGSEHAWFEG